MENFKVKMTPESFFQLYENILLEKRFEKYSDAYHEAEKIHRLVFGGPCYPGGYNSFRQVYNRRLKCNNVTGH